MIKILKILGMMLFLFPPVFLTLFLLTAFVYFPVKAFLEELWFSITTVWRDRKQIWNRYVQYWRDVGVEMATERRKTR